MDMTVTMLHTDPELVGEDFGHGAWQASARPQLLVTGTRGYTESRFIGRPSLATAERVVCSLDGQARSIKDRLALLL